MAETYDYICTVHFKNQASLNLVKRKQRSTVFETPKGVVEVAVSGKNGDTHLYAGYTGPKFTYRFKLNGEPITEKALKNL